MITDRIRIQLIALLAVLTFVASPANAQKPDATETASCGLCGSVSIQGNTFLSDDLICAIGRLGCANLRDSSDQRAAFARILNFYNRRGYLDATVIWNIPDGPIEIDEGACYTVGNIDFEGNHTISNNVLSSITVLDYNGYFSEDELDSTIARINDLKLFDTIRRDDVKVSRSKHEHNVSIVIHLRER